MTHKIVAVRESITVELTDIPAQKIPGLYRKIRPEHAVVDYHDGTIHSVCISGQINGGDYRTGTTYWWPNHDEWPTWVTELVNNINLTRTPA